MSYTMIGWWGSHGYCICGVGVKGGEGGHDAGGTVPKVDEKGKLTQESDSPKSTAQIKIQIFCLTYVFQPYHLWDGAETSFLHI